MTGLGASPGDMPGFPFPIRVGPDLDEHLLDTILTGQHLPPDVPEQAHVVAEVLASLAGPPGSGELTGAEAARSAFARAASPAGNSAAARRPARHSRSRPPARLSARLAAVAVAAAVALVGAAGAYAGVLPGPIQDLAHHVIGVPPAHHPAAHAPGARRAAYQLCTTYQRASSRGDAPSLAAALRELTRAAGDPGKIEAYCAAAGRPGITPSPRPAARPRKQPASARGKAPIARAAAKAHGSASGHGDAGGHGNAGGHSHGGAG
jgi:hypothetical protein